MLGCPLATPSNTYWFTSEPIRYWPRISLAAALSVGLHGLLLLGIMMYQLFYKPAPELNISMGAPDLPIHVQLITQSSQAQSSPVEPQPKVIEESSIVNTTAKSEIKTAAEPKRVEEKSAAKSVPKKENVRKNTQGAAENNSQASTLQKNEQVGVNQAIMVASKPRFRSQPQQPEYPMQARRRKQQGTVLVNITVEPNGRTSNVSVARSSGFSLLDSAALKAVRKWELYAHEINGQAVRATFQVPVEFELK